MMALVAAWMLAAAGCRASRSAQSASESEFLYHRLAASALSDSLSIRLDIALDSIEIILATPALADSTPTAIKTAAHRNGAKAYGIRATLRSEMKSDAAGTMAVTARGAEAKTSAEETRTSAGPSGPGALVYVLIIFSALLIFIHRKRKNQRKNSYL